jgi:phosphatidylglycerophosphate synthase
MKLKVWDRIHCLVLLAAAITFIFIPNPLLFIIPATLSFVILFYLGREELSKLKPFAGWANRVTAIRLIALLIVTLAFNHLTNWQTAIALGLILPFDALDGYLARKRKEQTVMGAFFDMETDVLFVCLTCCMLYMRGLAGFEVLFIGFLRYIYVLIVILFGFRHLKEKRTSIGPIIAVYVFIAVTLSFVVPEIFRKIILYSSMLLLIISFSYSFVLLLKQRR